MVPPVFGLFNPYESKAEALDKYTYTPPVSAILKKTCYSGRRLPDLFPRKGTIKPGGMNVGISGQKEA